MGQVTLSPIHAVVPSAVEPDFLPGDRSDSEVKQAVGASAQSDDFIEHASLARIRPL